MSTQLLRFTMVSLACLIWVGVAGVASADFTESEDQPFQDGDGSEDDPLSAAMPVPWNGLAYPSAFPDGVKLVRGSIDVGDVDAFAFNFSIGHLVLGALFEDAAGERNDTSLGIFTGGVAPPLAADDDGGSGFLSRFAFAPNTGIHQIAVTGFGDTAYDGSHLEAQTGLVSYWLVVAATFDPPPHSESESNDTIATATPVPPNGGVVGATLDVADVDHFSIELEAGDRLAISVFDLATGSFASDGGERNDVILGLFDPLGAAAPGGNDDDSGPGRMSNLLFTAPSDGVYTIAVSGFGDDGFSGDHQETAFDYLLVVARERACLNVPALVSNIVASSGDPYVTANLQGGDHYYIDRTVAGQHVVVDVPPKYECSEWIKTANDDKNVSDPSHLSFSLSSGASVFVAYDSRATAEPAWLSAAFTQTGDVVDVRDPDPNQEFDVLRRDFDAGTVVLGGNLAAGAGSNYVVFVRPLPANDPSQAFTIPPGATSVTVTINGLQIQATKTSGQTAADLAQALAAAVNSNPTLMAARIYGLGSGNLFVTTGVIGGISVVADLPAFGIWGWSVLSALLLGFGMRGSRRAR